MTYDRSYLMRRAAQERSAADRATGPKAREAHETMARHYQELLESARQTRTPTSVSG